MLHFILKKGISFFLRKILSLWFCENQIHIAEEGGNNARDGLLVDAPLSLVQHFSVFHINTPYKP